MTSKADQSFNIAVHGLRGIASVMVFLAHLIGGVAEHVYADKTAFVAAQTPYWNFGTYGVWLFFAISGFVILPSAMRYSLGEFAARRFMRIYPMFFAFSFLFIVLNLITQHMPELNDPITILAALTFTNNFIGTEQLTPNAWSLNYEVMFYALTALILAFGVKSRRPLLLMVVCALAFSYLLWKPGTLFFIAGVLIRIALDRGIMPNLTLARVLEPLAAIALIYATSLTDLSFHRADMAHPITWIAILATAVYFYLAVLPGSLTGRLLSHNVFQFLGTVSFSLYLLHPYIYLPMRMIFVRFELFTDNIALSMALFYVAVSIPTLIATWFVHKTLEVWPYKAVFHRRVFAGAPEAKAV